MILWYYNEIYVYTGDGPMWPTKADHQCNGQWWPFLLYVNNFVESRVRNHFLPKVPLLARVG